MSKGLISHRFITMLLSMVNIIQIMKMQGIDLKPSGRGEYRACCPFHSERTPSFYVSEDRQVYNCFGCHAKGNVITFVMNYNKYSYPEAIEYLADLINLPIEYDDRNGKYQSSQSFSDYYTKMQICAEIYARILKDSKMPQGLNYFTNRGITLETIDRFKLGYAPPQWQFLTQVLVKDPQKDLKILSELGLISRSQKNGNFFDTFRNRVMIPILDRRGRVIGFGGRVLNDDQPKYLNSPEMAIFHKGRELFGLYQALESAKENQNNIPALVIVEGYMDVIALSQAGFNYAVASLGTSTTADQFALMFRYTKQVICCYDGDAAGQKAAWHALNVMLPTLKDDCEVKFAFLPVEHDPDSFVREFGVEGFQEYLNKALPLKDYLFEHLKKELVSADSRRELTNNALEVLAAMPNNLRLEELLSTLATLSYQDIQVIKNEWQARRNLRARSPYNNRVQPQTEEKPFEMTPIRRAYALSIQYPTSAINGKDCISNLLDILDKQEGVKGIAEYRHMFNYIVSYPNDENTKINTATILNACQNTKMEGWVTKLANIDIYGHNTNITYENITADITATLSKLILERYEVRVAELQNESFKHDLSELQMNELSDKIRFIKKFSGKTITFDKPQA